MARLGTSCSGTLGRSSGLRPEPEKKGSFHFLLLRLPEDEEDDEVVLSRLPFRATSSCAS